jgi:hypothetical protein
LDNFLRASFSYYERRSRPAADGRATKSSSVHTSPSGAKFKEWRHLTYGSPPTRELSKLLSSTPIPTYSLGSEVELYRSSRASNSLFPISFTICIWSGVDSAPERSRSSVVSNEPRVTAISRGVFPLALGTCIMLFLLLRSV